MGKIEIDHTGSGGGITLSSDGTSLLLGGTAIGGSPDLYAANDVSATAPSATGTNAVAIGDSATAAGVRSTALTYSHAGGTDSFAAAIANSSNLRGAQAANAVAIGSNAYVQGTEAIGLGYYATIGSSGLRAVALGHSYANNNDSFAAAIGNNTSTYGAQGPSSVAIGYLAKATGNNSYALGEGAVASANGAMALLDSEASGTNSFAAGEAAVASGSSSISIGAYSDATGTNALAIGAGGTQSVGTNSVAIGYAYASGNTSFAASIGNYTSSYGATGDNSIAMGYLAKASTGDVGIGYTANAGSTYTTAIGYNARTTATQAVAIGRDALASGQYSLAIGGNGPTASGNSAIAMGGDATAQGIHSFAIGAYAKAIEYGKFVRASGRFAATGDVQTGISVLRSDTTDATAEALTSNNSTPSTDNQIILPNNSAYSFSGTIVARQDAASGTACAAWKIEGLIRREGTAATTTLVNSATTVLDNTPSWGMALSADTTNGGLKIEVTGAASTNIRWVATINTSEVTYA